MNNSVEPIGYTSVEYDRPLSTVIVLYSVDVPLTPEWIWMFRKSSEEEEVLLSLIYKNEQPLSHLLCRQ